MMKWLKDKNKCMILKLSMVSTLAKRERSKNFEKMIKNKTCMNQN